MLLLTSRVTQVWNQTGQKHTGEPDIARNLLVRHNFSLWFLVLISFVEVTQRLSHGIIPFASRRISTAASVVIGTASFGFKVAFTKADAPELLNGLGSVVPRIFEEVSLVAVARAVFLGIGILILLTASSSVDLGIPKTENIQGIHPRLDLGIND